jgi:hypothetical protein
MGQRPDELRPRKIIVRLPPTEEVGYEPRPHLQQEDGVTIAREEIEQTRADMTGTIEAIQDKLDPEVLSEHAKDTAHDVTDYAIREAKEAAREITEHAILQAREVVQEVTGQARLALREATIGKVEHVARSATDTATGWRASVVESIKANPTPAALVGLGLGWMFLNRPSSNSTSSARFAPDRPRVYGGSPSTSPREKVGDAVDRAQATAAQVAGQVQDSASQVVDRVQDTGGQMIEQVQETGAQVLDQVQDQAAHAQTFLQRQLQENALLVGAVAVAVGGVLAGTIRSTPGEDQLLGQTRDRLVGSAKELTQDAMQKVGRVVEDAQDAARETARQESLIPEA